MRQTCTDHCSECGGHFHGTGAYELHLQRVNERKNRWGAPEYDIDHTVGEPAGLQEWTSTGHCAFTEADGVTVWQRKSSPREVEFFARKRAAI